MGLGNSNARVVGRVRHRRATLRKKILYGNSYQTVVEVSLQAEARGCAVKCRAGLAAFVQRLLIVWFVGVAAIGGAMFVMATLDVLTGSQHLGDGFPPFIALLTGPLMLGAGIAMYAFGRWLARDEEGFLINFLRETLDAE